MMNMTEGQRLNEFLKEAPDIIRTNGALIDYLCKNGYFTAPASAKYHGNYPGGLFDHCYKVYEALQWLTSGLDVSWARPESVFIVAFFHDLCKIDQYIEIEDNPGKVMFGETEPQGREIHYEYNNNLLLTGHGAKSVMLLSQFMQLTEEEILCIRYHMGAYEKDDWIGYDLAIKKYPNVLFTHTADMYASKVEGT